MIPAGFRMTHSIEPTRAWVDVDLAALIANARTVAQISGTRLLPVVKANGYGLGAIEVARALERINPWGFGVASVDEGAALRNSGIDRPILVLTPLLPRWIDRYLELDLRPAIGDAEALNAWTAHSRHPFHLEIDTGMSRSGIRWNDPGWERIRAVLETTEGWEGVFTHFSSAESDADTTAREWQRFQEILRTLPRRPPLVHAANSAAALQGAPFAADMVRPGIFLYGGRAGSSEPRPVAALRARVVALRAIGSGEPVGYNAVWRPDQASIIATVAVGYADGFPRSTPPGRSRVIELGGRVVPVAGRVTMDMCMVALSEPVAIGEVATVFGGLVSLDQQAEAAGTISYELLTRLGPRLPRCYRSAI
jgi:alanine racemase